jgi:hypothetical protein
MSCICARLVWSAFGLDWHVTDRCLPITRKLHLEMAVAAEGKKTESLSISAINQTIEFASNSIIKPSITVITNVSSHYMMVRNDSKRYQIIS